VKRFTETTKWVDPWFMDLPVKYKAFWFYICDQCDCAGFWEPNIRLAVAQIGEHLEFDEILQVFVNRIIQTDDGKLWVKNFIRFQYGLELNPLNTAHLGVLKRLEINNLDSPVRVTPKEGVKRISKNSFKPLPRAFKGPKDKDKDRQPLASPYQAPNKDLAPTKDLPSPLSDEDRAKAQQLAHDHVIELRNKLNRTGQDAI